NSALVHSNLGDPAEELRLYLLARQAFDKAGDLAGIATTSSNIGTIYVETGQKEEAEAAYQQALAFAIEAGKELGQANALLNLGELALNQGEPERALELLRRSLEIHLTLDGYQTRLIDVYFPLGEAWTALGDDSRALDYHRRALALATELDDQQRQIIAWSKIALVHRRRGELDTAIGLLEQAVEVAREQRYIYDLRWCLHDLQQAYAEAGRYRQAYEALEEYEALNSESLGKESRRAIAEMQAGFEAAEREKAIELLEIDQALQRAELDSQRNLRRGL
ncbi:MAG: tetratricopeptide repeat protein, partial [Deltaproteobacteria bacterium]|nr:tetratricopeptide repeat protein [Deltaproteobacteria bacterium]